ncbi:hypothetical protein [Deinococcus arcticus]|uniref:Uncharacterized protein n=1 Tax=Deinococcus arcticus TaxID=2136176 RepID=A0A2T3WAT6_9DEIO|nr:hypothetical protein [Deinococcus arcticus]PTA69020.1 hypothetical protein C8263_04280 [Deinococcus arcticus]
MFTELFRQSLALIAAAPGSLWPGFTPAQVPYLTYDGHDTRLWNADPGEPGWQVAGDGWLFPGRHPCVTANSAASLANGTGVATLLGRSFAEAPTPRMLAALAVHEAFHVYQQRAAPEVWQANELDALTYPTADPAVLSSRAMETAALQRALAATGEAWQMEAGRALAWRRARFAHLAPEHVTYERAMERREGLAHFVELRFLGESPVLPAADWSAGAVRARTYVTGAAYATLLDRLGPGWPAAVLNRVALDELLAAQVPARQLDPVTPAVRAWVQAEVERVANHRAEARQSFARAEGPRVVVQSTTPLSLQGFDPLNMIVLGDGLVLHQRFLRFGHDSVQAEVFGRACLTLSAGDHPLMSGLGEVVMLSGADLRVSQEGRLLQGEGLTLRSQQAPVEAVEGGFRLKLA